MTILTPRDGILLPAPVSYGYGAEIDDDGSNVASLIAWRAAAGSFRGQKFLLDSWGNVKDRVWVTGASGTGAARSILSAAKYQGYSILSTGTTTTGRCSRTVQVAGSIWQLGAATGVFVYDTIFRIPTLSTGADQFVYRFGYLDSISAAPTDGMYFEIDSQVDAQLQACTRSNSTETRTDTGQTISANTWYRARITAHHNSSVDFEFGTAYAGAAMSTITPHTTNIPSGAARVFGVGCGVIKSAGTNARTVEYLYQLAVHDRNGS